MLAQREVYELPLLDRRPNHEGDSPLEAIYRIYEHIMLDQHLEILNELETFWYHNK